MANRYNLQNIKNLNTRSIFFDANVLIYNYWPTDPQDRIVRSYSKIFKYLIKNENKLYINLSVLSEVINRVLRLEYNKGYTNVKFKEYRDSAAGKKAQEDLYSIIKENILPYFQIINTEIKRDELEDILIIDSLDFGDKIIVNICQKNDFILLTNDSDFKTTDIDILSANSKIVKQQ